MNLKNVQNYILSETKRKLKNIKYKIFNNIRRKSMTTIKNMIRLELRQELIFV